MHQQFTHVLALRAWKETEIAARIRAVDDIDFPCAMRIIDHMVAAGMPIAIPPDGFAPGADVRGILLAERAAEGRLRAALAGANGLADGAGALIEMAETPRAAYGAWLDARLAELADRTDGAP